MAVVFLLNLIFSTVTTISNMVSQLILNTTAHLLVLLIHGLKFPGEAVLEVIRSFADYLMELIVESVKTLISTSFDLLIGGVTESAGAINSMFWDLLEKTRGSLEVQLQEFPEAVNGFVDMVFTVVADLWNNCMEAWGYVTDNA